MVFKFLIESKFFLGVFIVFLDVIRIFLCIEVESILNLLLNYFNSRKEGYIMGND